MEHLKSIEHSGRLKIGKQTPRAQKLTSLDN